MRMGMFGIEVKSTFEYTYERPTRMEWKAVAGTIKVLMAYEYESVMLQMNWMLLPVPLR